MPKERLLLYTDAVVAIIITIMVLELKAPHDTHRSALYEMRHEFLSYILSFVYITIYWNNHHHLFHTINKINGKMMRANSTLLFFLSLIPFATSWMATNHFETNTVVFYGIILLCVAGVYLNLEIKIAHAEGKGSLFTKILRRSTKEKLSLLMYVLGIVLSFAMPLWGLIMYYIVAVLRFIPDKRLEKIANTSLS